MDDLYYYIRIMQISTEKLQSTRYCESLRRTSLIRSTFLQSRQQFCDLLYSFIKISPAANSLLPVIIQNENREKILTYEQTISKKRKSTHVESVKRLRLTSSSSPSSNTRIEKQNLE